jgi:GR25 family glycosyltransferase involved in LPS biosynthesis
MEGIGGDKVHKVKNIQEGPYTFFDDVVCINLKERTDRYQWVSSVFEQLNIPVRFVFVERSPKGGMYGCFESHIDIIKHCYEKGCNNILIFEDDIYPTATYDTSMIQEAVDFMKSNDTWDLFYLGYFAMNEHPSIYFLPPTYTKSKHIVKFSPLATHAYCLSRRAMQKILRTYQEYIGKTHIDMYFSSKEMNFNNFCFTPILFEQKLCMKSDNSMKDMKEYFLRQFSCFTEKTQINYNVTKLSYNIEKNMYVLMLIIVIFIILIALMLIKNKQTKFKIMKRR